MIFLPKTSLLFQEEKVQSVMKVLFGRKHKSSKTKKGPGQTV